MSNVPSNSDDIIDSREVIERIAELEAVAEEGDSLLDQDERIDLEELRKLAAEASDYAADWEYGETLIRDSYFVTYAQEFAEDIGAVNPDAGWPNSYIDWERAARELRMDYTSVEFDGVTYWIR
jgi:antirestriction protein